MNTVRITPPKGSMSQFKNALAEAQRCYNRPPEERLKNASYDAFARIGVQIRERNKPRTTREVLDEVVRNLHRHFDLVAVTVLFGKDGTNVLAALLPMIPARVEIVGIDLLDERDRPYWKALTKVIAPGPIPSSGDVAAALASDSPDGPKGNIWKLYDARIAKRTGDWSGVSDRAFIRVGTTSLKDTLSARLEPGDIRGFYEALNKGFVAKAVVVSDEVDLKAWDPLAEADAIAKATRGPDRGVTIFELARLLGRDEGTIIRWVNEGCPIVPPVNTGAEPTYEVKAVVHWLEAQAARHGRLERRLTRRELAVLLDRPEIAVEKWVSQGCPVVDGSASRPMRFDVSQVVSWLRDQAAAGACSEAAYGTRDEAERRKAVASAELAECKLEDARRARQELEADNQALRDFISCVSNDSDLVKVEKPSGDFEFALSKDGVTMTAAAAVAAAKALAEASWTPRPPPYARRP